MKEDEMNYGVQREHEPRPGPNPSGGLPGALPDYGSGGSVGSSDERTWAAVAHLSIFLNIFTGFLGPVVAGVIWLLYKDRSRMVASHASKSVVYQVGWLIAMAVGWPLTFALMQILIGFLLLPVMAVITVAPFVYAAWAAYAAYQGRHPWPHGGRHFGWAACHNRGHKGYRGRGSTHYV